MHNRYVFREEAREMFYHAYNAYMVSAFVVFIIYLVILDIDLLVVVLSSGLLMVT